jgi:hypothetical protein
LMDINLFVLLHPFELRSIKKIHIFAKNNYFRIALGFLLRLLLCLN